MKDTMVALAAAPVEQDLPVQAVLQVQQVQQDQ